MASEHYVVSGLELQDVINQLNIHLGRIAERLDAIEGIHGDQENRGQIKVLDSNDNLVSGFLNE